MQELYIQFINTCVLLLIWNFIQFLLFSFKLLSPQIDILWYQNTRQNNLTFLFANWVG